MANTPTAEPTALETDSQDALARMESEAADFFNAQNAERTAALNPVSAALDAAEKPAAAPRTAPRGKQAQASAASPSAKANPTPASAASASKIPGAPTLRPVAAAAEKEGVASSTVTPPSADVAADPAAAEFADISRDYKPGNTRAPQWEKLHAKADHYVALVSQRDQELADSRAQLEQLRAAAASAEPSQEIAQRLATIQQERDSLQAKLEAVAVERSPRFEAQFKPRRDAAFAQAKAAVGSESAGQIEALLQLPESAYRDEQIEQMLTQLPALRATKLTQAVADLDRLSYERQQLAAQGSELYKSWTAEESAARDRQRNEHNSKVNATFEAELKEWAQVGLSAEDVAAARDVYSGKGNLQDASRASLWAVVGPKAAMQLQAVKAEKAELEAELSKLRKAQPGVGAAGGGALPSAAEMEDDPSLTGYADRIAKEFLRSGGRFGG